MDDELLATGQAAQRLGISRAAFYSWLAQSNAGTFIIQGYPVTIAHMQGGAKGRGKIVIEAREIERLKNLMWVRPRRTPAQRPAIPQLHFPGITAKLGRPND